MMTSIFLFYVQADVASWIHFDQSINRDFLELL